MGTPAGVGQSRTPPVWMKAGDVFEVEIDGLGTLKNTIVGEV
jgi:2-keto-4-pentenoate hydratase/2-oxohepta-3-ene-1,7-dioic acid hydratase in catechol pathway